MYLGSCSIKKIMKRNIDTAIQISRCGYNRSNGFYRPNKQEMGHSDNEITRDRKVNIVD